MPEWIDPLICMPQPETVVVANISNGHGRTVQENLIHVVAEDHCWVTADDRTELNEWGWTVVGWSALK